MKILVCNAGSTSLKFKLFDMPQANLLAQGKIERVGSMDDATFQFINYIDEMKEAKVKQCIPDYRSGINLFLDYLISDRYGVLRKSEEIQRVGFKTVLAKNYYGVHELTADVLRGMEEWMPIAPSHNGPYLEVIQTLRDVLPSALFVGVFETAFHQTIPLERRLYGVPYEWYTKYGIQRMGYHGASHGYIADTLNTEVGAEYRAISCHLGGSCSVCAIENGKSVNNSFGLSLQSGLIHANRAGDMDCDIVLYLRSQGMQMDEINSGLKKQGGLLGLSDVSNDLRYIEEAAAAGNERAKLAIDVFVNGIIHYIGAYYAQLGGLDLLVFTGGIGENSKMIRKLVCEKLRHIGIILSESKNLNCVGKNTISSDESRVKIQIIPADEESGIARRTYEFQQANSE